MMKVWVRAPSGTTTVLGTVATVGELFDSATVKPPAGAGRDNVTMPSAGLPPATVDGATASDSSVVGSRVSTKVRVVPPPSASVAVMVTVVCAATGEVVTGNITLRWRSGIVTLAGT